MNSTKHFLLWGALACEADICRVTGDIGTLHIGCAGYHIGTLGPVAVDKLRRLDPAALAPATAESNAVTSARWIKRVMPQAQTDDVSNLQVVLCLLSKLPAAARRILAEAGFEGALPAYAVEYAEALSAPIREPRTDRVLMTLTDAQRTAMLFTGTRAARLAYAERELEMEEGSLMSFKDLSQRQLAHIRRCLSGDFAQPPRKHALKLAA